MESIKELRQMLQTNVLGHPILQRVLSIYITRPLLSTSITANEVSVAMLLVGAAGAACIFASYIWAGFALVYLSLLLDAVDGEIARYRKTYSLRGIYLDLINHLLTQALFFLAVAFWVAQSESGTMRTAVLLVGVLGALSMPLRRANGDLHRELYVHHYSAHPERFSLPALVHTPTVPQAAAPRPSLLGYIKKAIYQSEYLAFMLVIFVLAYVAELLLWPALPNHPLLAWLVLAYGALSCIYFVREVIGGYRTIEARIAAVRDKLNQ